MVPHRCEEYSCTVLKGDTSHSSSNAIQLSIFYFHLRFRSASAYYTPLIFFLFPSIFPYYVLTENSPLPGSCQLFFFWCPFVGFGQLMNETDAAIKDLALHFGYKQYANGLKFIRNET